MIPPPSTMQPTSGQQSTPPPNKSLKPKSFTNSSSPSIRLIYQLYILTTLQTHPLPRSPKPDLPSIRPQQWCTPPHRIWTQQTKELQTSPPPPHQGSYITLTNNTKNSDSIFTTEWFMMAPRISNTGLTTCATTLSPKPSRNWKHPQKTA